MKYINKNITYRFNYVICLLLILFSLVAVGCAGQTPEKVALSPSVQLAHVRSGQGQPVILLQAGLGDGASSWSGIVPELAALSTVVAYDRPGYGGSTVTTGPRDPCTIAREAHALLATLHLPPPYVLVGHSLGGLYQYAFARLYPQDVAGLVLLDATHPRHLASMRQHNPGTALFVTGLVNMTGALPLSGPTAAEFQAQTTCLDAFEHLPPLNLPVRVLVHTRSSWLADSELEATFAALTRDWLRLTGATMAQRVPQAGHYIHHDQPEAAVRAVAELVQAARR